MKELEIQILEDVTKGILTTNDMLCRLLLLYGISERYFYHYVYNRGSQRIITDELIECTKLDYDKLCSNEKDEKDHRPVKYMSDQIPTHKKIRKILYIR